MPVPATIFEVERLETKFGLSQRRIFELQARFLAAVNRKPEAGHATPADHVLASCSAGQPPTLESFIETYMVFSQPECVPEKLAFLYKWLVRCSPGGDLLDKKELNESDVKVLFEQHESNEATLKAKLSDVLADEAKSLSLVAFQDYMMHRRPIEDLAAKLTVSSTSQGS